MRRSKLSLENSAITSLLVVAVSLASASMVNAQLADSLNFESASRLGLTPAWSKAISSGYGGKISGVDIYVSPKSSYQATEVVDKYGRRTFFSDLDIMGRRQSRSGYDQTLRLTDLKKAELSARGLDPQSEVKQIPEVTVYVRSTAGTVTALDAETGQQKWAVQAGKPGYPSYGVSVNDDHVATLSGANLFLLDAKNGQVLDNIPLRFLPGGTPTIDGELIYLPTTKGVIDVIETSDLGRKKYTLGSSGRIESSVTVSPSTVSWCTSDGYIYVARAGIPGVIYRFQSLDTMVAAPVYMDATLFAASLDGYVYALDEANGDVKWRYAAGGQIREAPIAVEGCIYVTTEDGEMSAVDAETGNAKWLASGVKRFLSVSNTRVYCMTSGQLLTVLDRTTGNRIGSVAVGNLGLPIVNTRTDRVYLINQTGVLHCFREFGNRWPIARIAEVREETEPGASEATEAAAAANEVAPSTPASPSATDQADIFGEPDAAEPTEAPATDTNVDDVDVDPFGDLGEEFGGDGKNPFEEF